MSGLSQYLTEKAQAKTGLSTNVVVGYGLQAMLGVGSTILFFVAVFFVFADYLGFGGTATSIGMLVLFVLLLVGAIIWTNSAKKKTIIDAERALAHHSLIGLNAPLLSAGMQLGQKIGWRRALPAIVVLLVATGVAAEWSRRQHDRNY